MKWVSLLWFYSLSLSFSVLQLFDWIETFSNRAWQLNKQKPVAYRGKEWWSVSQTIDRTWRLLAVTQHRKFCACPNYNRMLTDRNSSWCSVHALEQQARWEGRKDEREVEVVKYFKVQIGTSLMGVMGTIRCCSKSWPTSPSHPLTYPLIQ